MSIMHDALPDIQSEADVRVFVDHFYDKVVQDDLLGPVFNDVAQVDWSTHLPAMYSFWSAILLGIPGYNGAPFPVHAQYREQITADHFVRWLQFFESTIDTLYSGPVADAAKQRARSIAMVFQSKLGLLYQHARPAD